MESKVAEITPDPDNDGELICVMPDDGKSVRDISIPDSVHHMYTSQIDQLEAADKTVLKMAAVVGLRFTMEEINQLGPSDSYEGCADSIDSLMRAGLIRRAVNRGSILVAARRLSTAGSAEAGGRRASQIAAAVAAAGGAAGGAAAVPATREDILGNLAKMSKLPGIIKRGGPRGRGKVTRLSMEGGGVTMVSTASSSASSEV